MSAIQPRSGGALRTGWAWGAPAEASAAVLEVVASARPGLVEFQAQALLHSTMSFAVRELAAAFGIAPEKVGAEVGRACDHLDRLEKSRLTWRDPAEILDSPNLAALLYTCRARLRRASPPTRRFKLERILRRLEAAYEKARTRAWVEDFIGPLPARPREAPGDVR